MAIRSSEVVERIMDDSDYNLSGGSTSDEDEELSGSGPDMLDIVQVCFPYI